MPTARRTGIAATAALGVAVLSSCSGDDGPSRSTWAGLVATDQTRLTEVVVTDVDDAPGNWTRLRGDAVVAADLYDRVDATRWAELCDDPLALLEAGRVLERTAVAGAEAEFDVELVAEEREPGSVDSDGDVLPADEVVDGWTVVASGGGFTVDGVSNVSLGFPLEHYGDDQPIVLVGTPAVDEACGGA